MSGQPPNPSQNIQHSIVEIASSMEYFGGFFLALEKNGANLIFGVF